MGDLSNVPIPDPLRSPNPQTVGGVEKSPFQISALEVDENVNVEHILRIHCRLVVEVM